MSSYHRSLLVALNQVFELERKIAHGANVETLSRNVLKLRNSFKEIGLEYEDPMGQVFDETRSDLEATITGLSTENLRVIEVIKPIVRASPMSDSEPSIWPVVQRGVVVVKGESISESNDEQ